MIQIYNFKKFKTHRLDSRVLTETGIPYSSVKYSFLYRYNSRSNIIMVPVPKKIEVIADLNIPHKGKIDIKTFSNTTTNFTFNDKVYIHPDCEIPRAKVTQKYTRVLKPEKADICVVPNIKKEINTYDIALFINKDKGSIFILDVAVEYKKGNYLYYTAEKCSRYPLGSSILDINPSLKNTTTDFDSLYPDNLEEAWKDFLESSLLYYGPVVSLYSNESWIIDILYNKLHDIITEDKILATLGDSTNEFTKEAYNNIKDMLNSSDRNVVGLGLKAIAEMDYEKYRNTAIYLLYHCKSKWMRNPMMSSNSVKYMLNYLDLLKNSRENYNTTTTQEDFNLLKDAINDEIKDKLETLKKMFTLKFSFINIDLSYQVDISPKLNSTKSSSDIDSNKDVNCNNSIDN